MNVLSSNPRSLIFNDSFSSILRYYHPSESILRSLGEWGKFDGVGEVLVKFNVHFYYSVRPAFEWSEPFTLSFERYCFAFMEHSNA